MVLPFEGNRFSKTPLNASRVHILPVPRQISEFFNVPIVRPEGLHNIVGAEKFSITLFAVQGKSTISPCQPQTYGKFLISLWSFQRCKSLMIDDLNAYPL